MYVHVLKHILLTFFEPVFDNIIIASYFKEWKTRSSLYVQPRPCSGSLGL